MIFQYLIYLTFAQVAKPLSVKHLSNSKKGGQGMPSFYNKINIFNTSFWNTFKKELKF